MLSSFSFFAKLAYNPIDRRVEESTCLVTSHKMMVPILVAPALSQHRASSWIVCNTRVADVRDLSKIQPLRYFQRCQAESMMIEDKPRRTEVGIWEQEDAHKSTKGVVGHGVDIVDQHQARTSCQIWREKGHPTMR